MSGDANDLVMNTIRYLAPSGIDLGKYVTEYDHQKNIQDAKAYVYAKHGNRFDGIEFDSPERWIQLAADLKEFFPED